MSKSPRVHDRGERTAPDTTFKNGFNFDMQIKSRTGAIILIVIGALFLLSNFGWLPRLGPLFAQWWPLILIVVGVAMLVRK